MFCEKDFFAYEPSALLCFLGIFQKSLKVILNKSAFSRFIKSFPVHKNTSFISKNNILMYKNDNILIVFGLRCRKLLISA